MMPLLSRFSVAFDKRFFVGFALRLATSCTLAVAPARALDFTLRKISFPVDGQLSEHTCFHYDGQAEILLDPPRTWNVAATAGSLIAVPPALPGSRLQLEASPFSPKTAFEGQTLTAYRQRFLAAVPQDAQNVRIIKEQDDPLPIFGWRDYEFVVEYDFYGQSFRRSVMFINIDASRQLSLTVFAEHDKFEALHKAAINMMRTWSTVPADAVAG